jgi:hypothetical protein
MQNEEESSQQFIQQDFSNQIEHNRFFHGRASTDPIHSFTNSFEFNRSSVESENTEPLAITQENQLFIPNNDPSQKRIFSGRINNDPIDRFHNHFVFPFDRIERDVELDQFENLELQRSTSLDLSFLSVPDSQFEEFRDKLITPRGFQSKVLDFEENEPIPITKVQIQDCVTSIVEHNIATTEL